MSATIQPAVLDRIPLEIWCLLLENLSYTEVAACRFVNRRWSIAGALTMNKHRGPVSLIHTGSLIKLNTIMSSSTVDGLFSNFVVHPRAFTTEDSEEAMSTFLDIMGPTVKSYEFQPLSPLLKPLYSVDLHKHGRVLLEFLYKSPNLTSLTINFQDNFILPPDGLESVTSFPRLRHFTAIFPNKCCAEDGYLLFAGILSRSPRLAHLSFDYKFGFLRMKNHTRIIFDEVLEMLKELKQTITIRIKILPQDFFEKSPKKFTSLIGYSTLPRRFASIDVGTPPRGSESEWGDIAWDWAQAQAGSVAKLVLPTFPPRKPISKPFSRLHTFIIRQYTEPVPNMMLAIPFETVRVLEVGLIAESSVLLNFIGRLFNLEELTMKFDNDFDPWYAVTGEKVRQYRFAYEVARDTARGNDLFVKPEAETNCDTSTSPFLILKKLKILDLNSGDIGFYGILYITKQGSLARLKQLTMRPLYNGFFGRCRCHRGHSLHHSKRNYSSYRNRLGEDFETQLKSYHRKVEIIY